MDNELTGLKYIDAHRLRVYKDSTFQHALDLISSPDCIATTVQGGRARHVTDAASRQHLAENHRQILGLSYWQHTW